MVVTSSDSPLPPHKYLRRISKDFSTVRRFSNTPAAAAAVVSVRASTSAFIAAEAAAHLPRTGVTPPGSATPCAPGTPRGIRRRQRMRKRSSVSSTLSKVLILNVRDLLKAHAASEPVGKEVGIRKDVIPTKTHPPSTPANSYLCCGCSELQCGAFAERWWLILRVPVASSTPKCCSKVSGCGFVCRDNCQVAVCQSLDSKMESIVRISAKRD